MEFKPDSIKQEIKKTLQQELVIQVSDSELNQQIEAMTKIELMDKYLSSHEEKITSSEICKAVYQIFGIDLDVVVVLDKGIKELVQVSPLTNFDNSLTSNSRVAIDLHLKRSGNDLTGGEVRAMLNRVFGINLDGIAALENKRISLFSKGQWVVQNDKDLFIVHTGTDDLDVKVLPTDYFYELTGLDELPDQLQQALIHLGFHYDEKIGSYYFCDVNGHAIADKFKGQTLGAIREIIEKNYLHM
ncbi:hypothetical protein [Paenisporosarcina indica]|uniref:hypothetical protein n=1 Tax=Paenisporosarcina indica TaxID=650093 RepID=UPI000AFEB712|nr:hypothetical protein [Paenisporosarcina indica]